MIKGFIKDAERHLTDKKILRALTVNKKTMIRILLESGWKERISELVKKNDFSAAGLLEVLRPVMDSFSREPQEGWLKYICDVTIAYMYPENFTAETDLGRQQAKCFFMENYRCLLAYEEMTRGFSPVEHIDLLGKEEVADCITAKEYETLRDFWQENYIFEFMRVSREITEYNTVGHIGGVHYVATFVGKQLVHTDVPIDIALVSAAAAGHDLGKYGCSVQESKRIPYLHYYYTDELLKRKGMPMIAHIASNHSTWDLELENLSVESLLLIYADFRVKSKRIEGKEKVCFYTLNEAFDIILDKLDNVDEAKKHRYEKVYAKLKDFENYLIDIGVETNITAEPAAEQELKRKDMSLLMGEEVVENLKYMAIEHNIKLMSIFNNESSFGSLLEAARSERQWKSQRAYLNILCEYFTYMTKQEKLMTLSFLYELLSHHEGDIRRQAGRLMGTIIANYDDVYRKELPDFASGTYKNEGTDIWRVHLLKIVFPDYKVTDQHKSWIGYTLKVVMQGLLDSLGSEKAKPYMERYFNLFKVKKLRNSGVFVLLDSVIAVPCEMFSKEEQLGILQFAARVSKRPSMEIKIGAIRVAEYLSENSDDLGKTYIGEILDNSRESTANISVSYLAYKVLMNIGEKDKATDYYNKVVYLEKEDGSEEYAVSEIFRENLKVSTPWVLKSVNIDFLLEHALHADLSDQTFHLATHLSNLVKVSERVTVRHRAGKALIEIAKTLPREQVNEIVIELTKGLEIGEYQFSKYIPEYLGELALYLYPSELDEFVVNLGELTESTNDKIASVALDTIGEVLKKYPYYKYKTKESSEDYENRKAVLLGRLLKGLANYHEVVSQEAFMVVGQYIFGSKELSKAEKFAAFGHIYKKVLTLIPVIKEYDMNFFTNAAALNHIYRFISDYKFSCGNMELPLKRNIAFFPGTFDPFSLSHKGIVRSIRDEGFEVYLALDEFSWSKKTQPRMIRRQIITMSVADEADVFLFPDDFPVNIANPGDLSNLKNLFPGKDLYMVAGSDVITNASSYKAEPVLDSIHSMNHIVFRRETLEDGSEDRIALEKAYRKITGNVRELKLPVYLEDISSTRIRENIDQGRDIANLIDPIAQNFIYDNSLYLREPQYKNVLETKDITFQPLVNISSDIISSIGGDMKKNGIDVSLVKEYIDKDYVRTAVIKNSNGKVCALAAVNELETRQLYEEFKNAEIAAYLRKKTTGRMLVIRGLYCSVKADMRNLIQIMMTEVLAEAVADDITYAIYHPLEQGKNRNILDVLLRQGFTEIFLGNKPQSIFEVNMKEPIAVIENMDTVLKDPFNTNPKVLDILETTHADMQRALTKLNPGNLVLSFNAGVMNRKIVDMVTKTNDVPNHPLKKRCLGECMCVPFGKILRGMAVPNTVTKTLHTEKMFSPKLEDFSIVEYPMYSTIADQVRTIKSFGRPIILVDDLLHKGYRIKALDPIFKENDLEIRKLITGVLSGQGRDIMTIQEREVESAYFVPNLKAWFVESTLCPFIGGDGVQSDEKTEASLIPSINLILPFAAPRFLKDSSKESIYNLSVVCLENAAKIFGVLEAEYQTLLERKLTIKRLSDVIKSPRMPNGSNRVAVDFNLSPSVYMYDYMERLVRLESALK